MIDWVVKMYSLTVISKSGGSAARGNKQASPKEGIPLKFKSVSDNNELVFKYSFYAGEDSFNQISIVARDPSLEVRAEFSELDEAAWESL